jgi:hypothetical protein
MCLNISSCLLSFDFVTFASAGYCQYVNYIGVSGETQRTLRLPSLGHFDKTKGKIKLANLTHKFYFILYHMFKAKY